SEKTQPLLVPFVKDYGLPAAALLEYEREVCAAQGALPAADVDRLLEQSRERFLAAASPAIDVTPASSEAEPALGKSLKPKHKAETPIWNRSDPPGNPSVAIQANLGGLQSLTRKRGPK